MAAPQAYEQPSLSTAWEAVVAHLATLLVIWITGVLIGVVGFIVTLLITTIALGMAGSSDSAVALVSGLGQLAQLPFSILSSFVGVLFVAVPALYYDSGEVITVSAAFAALMRRPWRYLFAGLLFSLITTVGILLCILPGVVVALVMPMYVNRIFLTDQSIADAFASSFQAVYRSPHGISFVGIQILVWSLVLVVTVCSCGLGALLAVPVSSFYLQNAAYHKGLIS